MALKKVSWTDAGLNALEFFSKQMPLLAAGDRSSCNAMTISWGSLGTLWNRPVCTVYVRPQRYTFNLLEKQEGFSVCVMGEGYYQQLQYCGSKSGRDTDKLKDCGFTVTYGAMDTPVIQQAQLVLVCRKLYTQDLDPLQMLDQSIRDAVYPQGGFHRCYTGQVEEVYIKE